MAGLGWAGRGGAWQGEVGGARWGVTRQGGGPRQSCSFPAGGSRMEPGVGPELMDNSVTIQIPAPGIHLVTLKSEPFVFSDCCCDLLLWEL